MGRDFKIESGFERGVNTDGAGVWGVAGGAWVCFDALLDRFSRRPRLALLPSFATTTPHSLFNLLNINNFCRVACSTIGQLAVPICPDAD